MAELIHDDTTLYQFYREVTDTTWAIQGSISEKDNGVGDPMTQDKMAATKSTVPRGLTATMARLVTGNRQGLSPGSKHPAVSGRKKSLAQELHTLIRPENGKQPVGKGQDSINTVSRELEWLPSDYHVINDLTIPTESGSIQIDYVVIGPTGLYCIEIDRSAGRRDSHQGWIRQFYDMSFGKYHFSDTRRTGDSPLKRSIDHANCLTSCLKGRGFDVVAKALVVLTNAQSQWTGAHGSAECPVIRVRDLRDYIRQAPQNQTYDQDRAARILSLSTGPMRFQKAMQH